MFPASADNDVGVVTLALQVGQEGAEKGARILDERPRGQGFARAALSCVPRLSFEPATRDDGTRTAATSTVRLRFVRHL
jgi:TonB family protein